MIQTIKTPPRGTAGLRDTSLLGGLDDAPLTPNAEVAQARIELISAELSDTTGALIAQFEATLAMLAANDPVGAIYKLARRLLRERRQNARIASVRWPLESTLARPNGFARRPAGWPRIARQRSR